MMRSTKATAAVERLKARSGNPHYVAVRTAGGLFRLELDSGSEPPAILSEALLPDDFVQWVDRFGPQKPKRVSKLDVAFERQLANKRNGQG
jgi:hypothetical protein